MGAFAVLYSSWERPLVYRLGFVEGCCGVLNDLGWRVCGTRVVGGAGAFRSDASAQGVRSGLHGALFIGACANPYPDGTAVAVSDPHAPKNEPAVLLIDLLPPPFPAWLPPVHPSSTPSPSQNALQPQHRYSAVAPTTQPASRNRHHPRRAPQGSALRARRSRAWRPGSSPPGSLRLVD